MVANLLAVLSLAVACSALPPHPNPAGPPPHGPKGPKIQFEGRIPKGTKPTALDVENPWYNPGYVKGASMYSMMIPQWILPDTFM